MGTNGNDTPLAGPDPEEHDAPTTSISPFTWQQGFDQLIKWWLGYPDTTEPETRVLRCMGHIMAAARIKRGSCTLEDAWLRVIDAELIRANRPAEAEWWQALQSAWRRLQATAERDIDMNAPINSLPAWQTEDRFDELRSTIISTANPSPRDICEITLVEAQMEHSGKTLDQLFEQIMREVRPAGQAQTNSWWRWFMQTIRMFYLFPTA